MSSNYQSFSRRERQIMDVLYRNGRATAVEVRDNLADAPSYSAVRALLRILEDKGHIRHKQDGPRYVFIPTETPDGARRSAIRHLVETFFNGSAEQAVAALVDTASTKLSAAELDRLAGIIDQARGRRGGGRK